jgi:hypothetical protein
MFIRKLAGNPDYGGRSEDPSIGKGLAQVVVVRLTYWFSMTTRFSLVRSLPTISAL